MRSDAFRDQIGVIVRCGCGGVPNRFRLLAGLNLALGVLGLALAPHGLHARPVRGFLLRGQPAANIRPPSLGKSAAPVAESSGGNAVIMENIPARIIAGLPVSRESMQLAVWLADFRRRGSSAVDLRS